MPLRKIGGGAEGGNTTVYIDYDFYAEFFGAKEQSEDADRLFKLASEIIDSVTGHKISRLGFDNLDDFTREQVRLAAAAQTEYLDNYYDGGESSAVQMTLGKFSYMNSSGTAEKRRLPVSPLALSFLGQTGLIERKVGVM